MNEENTFLLVELLFGEVFHLEYEQLIRRHKYVVYLSAWNNSLNF